MTTTSFKKRSQFFGAAMFLRPVQPSERKLAFSYTLSQLRDLACKNPDQWECLLMKRNYLDFRWDHIGGNNEKDEFPLQTMQREVFEEVGWKVKEEVEVCRQWEKGFLKGFLYLALPSEAHFMEDAPPRVPCEEVQTVRYFGLLHILQSSEFGPAVKGRIQAFVDGKADFNID